MFSIYFSFPMVVFSVPLVFVVMYWLIYVVGGLDLDFLESSTGLLEGGGEVIDSSIEAAEGLVKGGDSRGVLSRYLRLGEVPLTVIGSAWVILGFAVTFLTLYGLQGISFLPSGILSLTAGVAGATALTRPLLTPIVPVFASNLARERSTLVGELCNLTTGRVDGGFGQAEVFLGGDHLVFQVRCDSPNTMKRGGQALMVSYDERREAFIIEPV